MTSTFTFGFSGDDIDVDDAELDNFDAHNPSTANQVVNSLPQLVQAEKHGMAEWLSALPSQISYNRIFVTEAQGEAEGRTYTLARREIFDIRAQLMAEDSVDQDNGELIANLEEGDIKPNFYEGGFKTWECALDLAKLLVNETEGTHSQAESRHFIELGAGTAMPSLALLAKLLAQPETDPSQTPRRTHFTFSDYNSAVLRLVTLPNILLTWNASLNGPNVPVSTEDGMETPTQEEELDITPELLERFENDLAKRGVSISFISGAWSPAFVDLALSSIGGMQPRTVILASETIYSPLSLRAFSETLLELLRRSSATRAGSRAFIAAKKVYFGVGGGVDEFLAVLKGISGDELDVREKLDVKSEGVGRIVLEIEQSENRS